MRLAIRITARLGLCRGVRPATLPAGRSSPGVATVLGDVAERRDRTRRRPRDQIEQTFWGVGVGARDVQQAMDAPAPLPLLCAGRVLGLRRARAPPRPRL